MKLPNEVERVLSCLKANGYEVYLVGGAVRDLMMGKSPSDWDIVTSASKNALKALLPDYREVILPVGRLVFYNSLVFSDGFISISIFENSIEEDVQMRDFTVNALLYDGKSITDYNNGLVDLEKRVLRSLKTPKLCFQDDPIRILRAVRFKIAKGFSLDFNHQNTLIECGCLLSIENPVRIGHELHKWMNLSPLAVEGISYLYETGLLKFILN